MDRPGKPRMHHASRLRRADSGSVLLEAIIAVVIVSVVMVAITAVLVTGTQASARQRSAQAAVQIATSALDQVQALGAGAIPAAAQSRTVNDVQFTTTYDSSCRLATKDSTTCDGGAGAPLVRVVATVIWQGNTCPAGGCTYSSTTLLSAQRSGPLRNESAPKLVAQGTVTVEKGEEMKPLQLAVENVTAPPLIFSGFMWKCAAGHSTDKPLAGSARNAYGFILDSTTGIITGKSATTDDFCVSITVTDADLNSDTDDNMFTISVTTPCFVDIVSARQSGGTYNWPWDSNVLKPDPNQPRCVTDVRYTIFEARVALAGQVYPWDASQMKCGPLPGSEASTKPRDDAYATDPMVCDTPAGANTGTVSFYNPRDSATYCIGITETRAALVRTYFITWTFGTAATPLPPKCASRVTP